MKIAVEGCAHGELDIIYSTIKNLKEESNIKIDLLICCGDFQSTRNHADLNAMAVPPKYRKMCSFHKYYSGEKIAPVLTIFIGGNHEASNYLQELPYGGWVAPNIYYLGYASVINIAGIRIGGLSGIYKDKDYYKGRFEKPPYNESSKRSVYHIRHLDVFRLKQIAEPMDVFLSHDWPLGIYKYGNIPKLLKQKPYFREDIELNKLGSKPGQQLLEHLKPKYWFAAHLHCKFAALVPHDDKTTTQFLSLDKCLPRRKFLQVLDIPHDVNRKIEINYDLEWLAILNLTNHFVSIQNVTNFIPGIGRSNFTPTEEEKNSILDRLNNTIQVPLNFTPTAPCFDNNSSEIQSSVILLNPQTKLLCSTIGIDDPLSLLYENQGLNVSEPTSEASLDYSVSDYSGSMLNVTEQETSKSDISSQFTSTPIKFREISDLSENLLDNDHSVVLSKSDPTFELEQKSNSLVENSNEDFMHDENGKTESKQSPKRSFVTDINVDLENSCQLNDQTSDLRTTKKFKRRNGNLYSSDS